MRWRKSQRTVHVDVHRISSLVNEAICQLGLCRMVCRLVGCRYECNDCCCVSSEVIDGRSVEPDAVIAPPVIRPIIQPVDVLESPFPFKRVLLRDVLLLLSCFSRPIKPVPALGFDERNASEVADRPA